MAKYEALCNHLKSQGSRRVPMSFREIERVVGAPLPPSAYSYRAWWSNNPENSVMTKAWLAAGFRSSEVDMARHEVVFVQAKGESREAPPAEGAPEPPPNAPGEDPLAGLYGGLRGTVRLVDVDLTQPASDEWAN